jgi:hypothetical protein
MEEYLSQPEQSDFQPTDDTSTTQKCTNKYLEVLAAARKRFRAYVHQLAEEIAEESHVKRPVHLIKQDIMVNFAVIGQKRTPSGWHFYVQRKHAELLKGMR